jgi:REP element-mobilizing transposase RayT
MYFVTICTAHRECYFGNITGGKIELSEIGEIVYRYWTEIPNHFPFVELGEFVIMPNHVHGIIIIDKPNDGYGNATVETQNFASLQTSQSSVHNYTNTFGPQSQNLASIIRGYKTGVKKYATLNRIDFAWQSRFHDHIIRSDESFQRISEYIRNNPSNWANDKFYDIW